MQDGHVSDRDLASLRQDLASLRAEVSELIALMYNVSVGMRELAESDNRFETELAEVRRKLDQNAGLLEKLGQVVTGRPHSH
jgi:predicted  nucleic acid-binding Zn-ribbon protein